MVVYVLIEADMGEQSILGIYSSPDHAKAAASNYYEDEDFFNSGSWLDEDNGSSAFFSGEDGSEAGIYIDPMKVDYMFD